jgi:hypothetical protein
MIALDSQFLRGGGFFMACRSRRAAPSGPDAAESPLADAWAIAFFRNAIVA